MGWFHRKNSDDAKAHNTVTTAPNKATLSSAHIAAAASYEAAERFEKHCEDHGKPQDDAEAKKILDGFTDTFIDGMVLNALTQGEAKAAAYAKNEEKLQKYGGY
ncbi:hypothetical protein DFH08DRAFT_948100 [Mycena albidolilacea]|uniref:CipC protein n=1 Tax=Mycena albidolilacea TaxID=1033008 RepID=A0AAD7F4W3_9AGAR|nr:hypothetical protein DFH08DRAFT_948100 [Mycena albidolilacea]